jgi:hypothetical protein
VAKDGYVACPVWIGLMRSAPALKMIVLNSYVTFAQRGVKSDTLTNNFNT